MIETIENNFGKIQKLCCTNIKTKLRLCCTNQFLSFVTYETSNNPTVDQVMPNEVEYKSQYYFEISVTICVFMWPVITIILLVLTNLLTFMLYVTCSHRHRTGKLDEQIHLAILV